MNGPSPPSDRLPPELARLFASVDATDRDQAWSAFVQRYHPLVLSVARSLGGDGDAVMDRYAFVLEHLRRNDFARLRRYRPDGRSRFTTWLVVVVRRLCLDERRRRYGQFRKDADEASIALRAIRRRLAELVSERIDPEALPGSGLDEPDRDLRSRELLEALEAALAELDPSDRLLLRLRIVHDLTGKEIARILRLPTPFHVYRRVDLVLARLRTSLSRAGIVEPTP